jgi:hypothetical protein
MEPSHGTTSYQVFTTWYSVPVGEADDGTGTECPIPRRGTKSARGTESLEPSDGRVVAATQQASIKPPLTANFPSVLVWHWWTPPAAIAERLWVMR